VVTCKIKSFTKILVLYFTCNHVFTFQRAVTVKEVRLGVSAIETLRGLKQVTITFCLFYNWA